MSSHEFLAQLGLHAENPGAAAGPFLETKGALLESIDPATNAVIGKIRQASADDYEVVVSKAVTAFQEWRTWPAPKRGEVVRQIGDALREHKDALGRLVALETGKIYQEGLGEVQEMIDICDFAVGLSRQLYGLSMHSERPGHRMYEQWHPIGTVGIISAFNFPVAVWAWNAMIAFVCGDSCIWKPSEFAPLCAVAVQKLTQDVLAKNGAPEGLSGLLIGSLEDVAQPLTADRRIPLISATGSCRMGNLAVRGILFGAVGTAGQRCTTTRRVFLHSEVAAEITERLVKSYGQVKIGNPLDETTLVGPLVHKTAVEQMMAAIETAKGQGGEVLVGGGRYTEGACAEGNFVQPTIVKATKDMPILQTETFAPLLYIVECDDLEEAIALNNDVPQGLSSAIFTRDLLEAERFLSALGSDCGIANVNIGTSGAEIGGAFGGEKETGGGREAGSDSWKAYMRRQTCTINYSTELPLAQGISFG